MILPAKLPAKLNVAILGASGYTGAELVRLLATHPDLHIAAMSADRKAGERMASVFPHLRHLELPALCRIEDIDLEDIDLCFCALPHATTQEVVSGLPRDVKIVDLSADFRLRDPAVYAEWYGHEHRALELQEEAVYGLTEFYREAIRTARLVAGTGCNSATGLYAVLPLLETGLIDPDEIIIDLATGVSGAGRSPKESMLHAEVAEGFHAYNIARHRHMAEFDQEFSKAAGRPVTCSFTAHLLPQNRGILATIYVRGDPQTIHAALEKRYAAEPFIV
ncbi:MAG TPA: N-acetyl-gamma-glutamyl-phosphate reductase, partial [Paracoccaceae bacterium]|nr:N-acetyl-gamma-glutamyl-phosphate reductase [Paracoccaceae bacterium]